MTKIHPSAIVDPKASLASDVEIGAYSIVGPNVSIDSGTKIGPHVVIEGKTTIGKNNSIFQFSSLGAIPQDKKYRNEDTELMIGDDNVIREFCTFNLGTVTGIGKTVVGDDNWIMAYVHIAHDCIIGDHTILANNTSFAGHVTIKDWVITGGFTTVHQFCQIGEHAMTAFSARVDKDIPPYVMAAGFKIKPVGINSEGLKRRGFTPDQMKNIKNAYKILYRMGLSFEEAKTELYQQAEKCNELKFFKEFFDQSQRTVLR